jgi:hypothetical protein
MRGFLAGLVHRDDVRLGQSGRDQGLTSKPLFIAWLGGQLGGQDLDRYIARHHRVVGLYTLPIAPSPSNAISRYRPNASSTGPTSLAHPLADAADLPRGSAAASTRRAACLGERHRVAMCQDFGCHRMVFTALTAR